MIAIGRARRTRLSRTVLVRYCILRLWLKHPRWGPDRIRVHLKKRSSLRGLLAERRQHRAVSASVAAFSPSEQEKASRGAAFTTDGGASTLADRFQDRD